MTNELNSSNTINNDSYNLFTIDVEKLYLSIQPRLAQESITDLLANATDEEMSNTEAIKEFVKISFNESHVTYKDRVIKLKVGIPTGGSLSRQIADTILHCVLFKKIRNMINTN